MPKLDGTGPSGKGPMTGKGGGKCVMPLDMVEQELDYLKNREEALKWELEKTGVRINKLKKRNIS